MIRAETGARCLSSGLGIWLLSAIIGIGAPRAESGTTVDFQPIGAPEQIARNDSPVQASPAAPPREIPPPKTEPESRWERGLSLGRKYPEIRPIVRGMQAIEDSSLEKPHWYSLFSGALERIAGRIAPCVKRDESDNGFSVQCGDCSVRIDAEALEGDGKYDVANRLSELVSGCVFRESADPRRDFRESFLSGIARSLGKRESYLTVSDVRRYAARSRKGYAADTGIQISDLGNNLEVVVVDEGSPAEKAGIRPGHFMSRIDNTSTSGMTASDAYRLLEGEAGTEVVVWALRKGESAPLAFPILREEYRTEPFRYRDLGGGIAYIRMRSFRDNTARDAMRAIQAQKRTEEGLQGLVLDLRFNTGGRLDQVIKVADLFLDSGVIVSTDGRADSQRYQYLGHREDSDTDIAVVVLVNRDSQPGAEIVAGSLQDHGRATVIGTRTSGIGGICMNLPLEDGSALILTTGRARLPKGRSLPGAGIEPDIHVEDVPGGRRPEPGGNDADPVLETGLKHLREMGRKVK